MRCANCDAEIPDESLYCDRCGNAVETSKPDEVAHESEESETWEGETGAAPNIPAVHTSKSWITVNPPSRPEQPRLDRIIIIGIAVIGVAVAILMLLGGARFVLSLLS